MPELPDVTVYVEHVDRRVRGTRLEGALVSGPNLLRTFDPPLEAAVGVVASGARRLGKRIAMGFEGGLFLMLHLMVAGRLHWFDAPRHPRGRPLATFGFERGTLTLTEADTRHRAALYVVRGEDALRALDAGASFPESVTAFRDGMAVHGRYREPCPECGSPVQRIRYAYRETNDCARCQTGGRRLADRGLARLLLGDWPRTLEEQEGV